VLEDRDTVEGVTKALMKAARLFSDDREAWVEAASLRRPDVSKEKIRKLWRFFRGDWPVNGGVGAAGLGEMLDDLTKEKGPGSTRRMPGGRLLAPEFEREALRELGVYPT